MLRAGAFGLGDALESLGLRGSGFRGLGFFCLGFRVQFKV